jgi:hypothetical protein
MIVMSEASGQGDLPSARPNDPLLAQQWALKAVNAAGGWKYEAFGQVFPGLNSRPCLMCTTCPVQCAQHQTVCL